MYQVPLWVSGDIVSAFPCYEGGEEVGAEIVGGGVVGQLALVG